MLEKKTVSQCINSDYCKGWNDAVDEINNLIHCYYPIVEEVESAHLRLYELIENRLSEFEGSGGGEE